MVKANPDKKKLDAEIAHEVQLQAQLREQLIKAKLDLEESIDRERALRRRRWEGSQFPLSPAQIEEVF
jgi:hypothetical protein